MQEVERSIGYVANAATLLSSSQRGSLKLARVRCRTLRVWAIFVILASVGYEPSAECRADEAAERPICRCMAESGAPAPGVLTATGHDSRIDLKWTPTQGSDLLGYYVYRGPSDDGPFEKVHAKPHFVHVYSDFVGDNDVTYNYRVTSVDMEGHESEPSQTASATTLAMNDDELLSSIQQAAFRYFWDFASPVSGLSREGVKHGCEICTTGGTGFGMMTIVVAAERGFVTREAAAERLLTMVTFLEEKAQRYHGVWSHWLNGETGDTISFAGAADNGGDIVETSFLIQGMLTARQYFQGDNATERELRERITRLWREVEWDWYLRDPPNKRLYWHWSTDYGWKMNHQIAGFNECLITYFLAMASPTHPIPTESYYEGWVASPETYANGKSYYGYVKPVGRGEGGPLFFTHYSFLGLDPHALTDRYCNYFVNNRNTTLINRAYCMANPGKFAGYGENEWGLTASTNPDGYKAHAPGTRTDDGTIAPTAAVCAIAYTPEESIAAIRHLYHEHGPRLWGPFGFYDAFNFERDWVSSTYLAIDQGPMAPMIENHRNGLCWKLFMANPEVAPVLEKLRPNDSVDQP